MEATCSCGDTWRGATCSCGFLWLPALAGRTLARASDAAHAGRFEQRFDLVGFERFMLEQRLGERSHRLPVPLHDLPRVIVRVHHDLANLVIDPLSRGFAHRMRTIGLERVPRLAVRQRT